MKIVLLILCLGLALA
jgi:hypothetical protein